MSIAPRRGANVMPISKDSLRSRGQKEARRTAPVPKLHYAKSHIPFAGARLHDLSAHKNPTFSESSSFRLKALHQNDERACLYEIRPLASNKRI